jgi:hypothetical protein
VSVTDTLPAIAAEIARYFPELNGRSVAVADAAIVQNKGSSSVTLPVCMVALAKETSDAPSTSARNPTIVVHFTAIFMFPKIKYAKESGVESQFWAFSHYETIRNRMIKLGQTWQTPEGAHLGFVGLDQTVDETSIDTNVTMKYQFKWCDPFPSKQPLGTIDARMYVTPYLPSPSCTCEPQDANCATCHIKTWSQ